MILQQVNQPIIGNVDGDWTSETLYNVATKQLEQKEYVQETLEQRVEELREQISTASRYIISDLNSKEFKKEEWDLNLRGHPLFIFEKKMSKKKINL